MIIAKRNNFEITVRLKGVQAEILPMIPTHELHLFKTYTMSLESEIEAYLLSDYFPSRIHAVADYLKGQGWKIIKIKAPNPGPVPPPGTVF